MVNIGRVRRRFRIAHRLVVMFSDPGVNWQADANLCYYKHWPGLLQAGASLPDPVITLFQGMCFRIAAMPKVPVMPANIRPAPTKAVIAVNQRQRSTTRPPAVICTLRMMLIGALARSFTLRPALRQACNPPSN